MAATASPDRVHRLLLVAVDTDFYRQAYPDLTNSEVDPPRHYDAVGWREGRDPAPWFSTELYLAANPDVAEAGLNPFVHYLTIGFRQGREAFASDRAADYHALTDADREARKPIRFSREAWAAAAEAFDPRYYLAMNPDVAQSGADPLLHFLLNGWREGRDPSYDISIADYLELNPDVAASGVHPFLHYVLTGRSEGRLAKARHGFREEVLARLKPFSERLTDSRRWARPVEVLAAERLAEAMARTRGGGLHLTFSQDDYSASVGGSQLCVQREAAEFAAMGRDHLHVHPVNGWPTVRSGPTETPMGVLWNGQAVGAFAPSAIAQALKTGELKGPRSFAIHNMLGHSSRDVVDIVRSAGLNVGFFWLHDMGGLCAGVHLLRNDIESCGAPPQGSAACGVCVYGPARAAHVLEHRRLFERLDLTVVAPSSAALAVWRERGDHPDCGAVMLPHARLSAPRAGTPPPAERPLRFAFPGTPSPHKGWPIFAHLSARFADDPRYEFVHLATKSAAGSLARHHPVTVTAADPLAMQQAMADLEIDVAMVWSLCLETFSFVAYEAAAAGAAVVTGPDSGNVAAFVAGGGHGQVLPDERVLEAWFESGEILKLARARRPVRLYDLEFSRLTAELLEA